MDARSCGGRPPSWTGRLATFCLLLTWALLAPGAAAADARSEESSAKRFGTVWKLHGEIVAIGASGERKLAVGDLVVVGERIRAAATGEAVFKTEDAGYVAVRPGGEFVAERLGAEGKASDHFTVRLIKGSLRVISGWIGRLNRSEHKVVTPTATIGIRGTDHEPYVLTAESAAATTNKAGTYDKVNRGGTTLSVGDNHLAIDSGRVGFVRADGGAKTRALMTILLPVLLDKVPDFYVPGRFDAELDQLSGTADADAHRELEQKRKAAADAERACPATSVARTWLGQLDAAITRGDAPRIIAMFAPEVAVRASVRQKDGSTSTVDLDRDELVQSTVAAVKNLKGYKHRRISIEAHATDANCSRIVVRSVVIEQGRQAGKPYRFESREEFVLEARERQWVAIKAETTQK